MRKKLICFLSAILLFCFSLFSNSFIVKAENKKIEALGATYEVKKNLITQDIGYGVTHIKDISQSSASRLNDYASCGPKDTLVGQQVNVLSIASSEYTRIVNWTYMLSDGWTKQTVKNLAKNFELHNPGWKVIAGVNGDFFDISGKMALPYQGNGIHVSNGEVYRPTGASSNVGFKNDGSSSPLVGGKPCTTGKLTLAIYDDNDEIIKEFEIDKINKTPLESEIAVWFTYNIIDKDGKRTEVPITISDKNCYIVKSPIRCLPINETTVYGKGEVNKNTDTTILEFGQFAIETTNQEVASYLKDTTTIRVQQNLTGDFSECDNVTGAGAQLLLNGEAVEEGGGLDRHPRTCVGVKSDGSIVLFTVDGRQFESNMYGMSYAELSAALLNYGCVEAYNLDGGGSTTMIIRNQYGDFDVLNSPSDGDERDDSNALLVVVPDISLSISDVGDTYANFSYISNKDITISNLKLSINDLTKEITNDTNEFVFDNLECETSYTLNYSYDINYKNSTLHDMAGKLYFSTGKIIPTVSGYYYEETDNEYIFHLNINDPKNAISICYIKYDKSTLTIYNKTNTTYSLPKTKVKEPIFELTYRYNIESKPSKTVTLKIPFLKWQEYSFTYELDGGINSELNKTIFSSEDLPITLKAPTKQGYTFIGWFDQAEGGNEINQIISTNESSFTVYARFIPISYTINYELDGGINNLENPTTFTVDQGIIKLKDPTKDNYKFAGWLIDDKKVTEINNLFNDVTVYATWEKIQEATPEKKGCSCRKNLEFISTLTTAFTLALIILRKKN